jgi:extracellular factor (EF) 3-hydroxypalmitic acid methyl ester biosynthesis protein
MLADAVTQDSIVVFKTGQGLEMQATLLKLTRFQAAFEVFGPAILRASEVLQDFKIFAHDHPVYCGRAIVSELVNTGTVLVCEAALQDDWVDVDFAALASQNGELKNGFNQFLQQWQKLYKITPEYKVLIADMQTFLTDLKLWLEQVELGIRSLPSADRAQAEREAVQKLQQSASPALAFFFEKFEALCQNIPRELQPAHRAYVKRQLHPLVLCAPFMYRTFQKPLGYAGDYEMINMMTRDPREGASVFAKILNTHFLDTAPVVAHRNRLVEIEKVLRDEVLRVAQKGRTAKIFNLGCGPATEIQNFVSGSELSNRAKFALLDFNEETLAYTRGVLNNLIERNNRSTTVELLKKSVVQILKEAAKPTSALIAGDYDFVYCAGLFDYLPDRVCEQLVNTFYRMLAPNGLLLVTNVDELNPSRNWMEYSVDWHLIYRNHNKMRKLAPQGVPEDLCRIRSEPSGVNIFLEARKPSNG